MSLSAGRPSKKAKDQLNLSDISNSEKKTVRVNFNIDEDKYFKLKKHALESRKTITQLLTELIDENIIER
jgi:hypothetical protein